MVESSTLTDRQLRDRYPWPHQRSFRLNMILGEDESVVGPDGTSLSLSSPEDRRILRVHRQSADVIISGAESIRNEGWHLPPQGRMIVLSQSGNVPLDTCPDQDRVYIASSISSALHNLLPNESNILCEGGISTAATLHNHVIFDELALSLRGRNAGPPSFLSLDEYALVDTLTELDQDMRFTFWRRAVKPV